MELWFPIISCVLKITQKIGPEEHWGPLWSTVINSALYTFERTWEKNLDYIWVFFLTRSECRRISGYPHPLKFIHIPIQFLWIAIPLLGWLGDLFKRQTLGGKWGGWLGSFPKTSVHNPNGWAISPPRPEPSIPMGQQSAILDMSPLYLLVSRYP